MVLHHVLQGSAVVIIAAAGFHAHFFQRGNLDALNMLLIPYVAENRVGKADCLDIAHHFFSQIVVDTVNMIRRKESFHFFIQRCRCLQTFSERPRLLFRPERLPPFSVPVRSPGKTWVRPQNKRYDSQRLFHGKNH